MSTVLRPELSEKNPNFISRHRYHELKHFCMQYYEWKRALAELDGFCHQQSDTPRVHENRCDDPTEQIAVKRLYFTERIALLEETAMELDEVIGGYVLLGVTKGIPYDTIRMKLEIPCCKGKYYELYRRFFWLLDKKRG